MLRLVRWKKNTTKYIERENMEFTKEQLQIIEQALEDTRDNTGDDDWYIELSQVLEVVRNKLKEKQTHDF